MDLIFVSTILFLSVFSFFAIKEDILTRKVSNKLNLLLFIFAIILLIFNFTKLNYINGFIILIGIIVSFFLHYKKIWGAADGKLFISSMLILISLFDETLFLNYLVNLAVIYSLTIIILVLFKTSIKHKKEILKKIDYSKYVFFAVCIFSLIRIAFTIIDIKSIKDSNLMLETSLLIFLVIVILSNYIKKVYKLLDNDLKFFINLALFFLLFAISSSVFLTYFIVVICIKVFIEVISEGSTRIISKGRKKYNSPFSIYILLVLIFTMLLKNGVLIVLIKFFS